VTGLLVPADIRRVRARIRIFACGQADEQAKAGGVDTLSGGQMLYPHLPDPLPSLVATTESHQDKVELLL
jgi:hypothetical protein